MCRAEWGLIRVGGGDAGVGGQPAEESPGGGAVQGLAAGGGEDRSGGALADELVQDVLDVGGQWGLGAAAALAADAQHPVPAVVVQVLDPGGEGFADPQPVEHE